MKKRWKQHCSRRWNAARQQSHTLFKQINMRMNGTDQWPVGPLSLQSFHCNLVELWQRRRKDPAGSSGMVQYRRHVRPIDGQQHEHQEGNPTSRRSGWMFVFQSAILWRCLATGNSLKSYNARPSSQQIQLCSNVLSSAIIPQANQQMQVFQGNRQELQQSGSAVCATIPDQQNFTGHDERFNFSAMLTGCQIGQVHFQKWSITVTFIFSLNKLLILKFFPYRIVYFEHFS